MYSISLSRGSSEELKVGIGQGRCPFWSESFGSLSGPSFQKTWALRHAWVPKGLHVPFDLRFPVQGTPIFPEEFTGVVGQHLEPWGT